MFKIYDEAVEFKYLKGFRRVRVIYSTPEQAQLAQDNLNNQVFGGDSLQLRPVKVANTALSKIAIHSILSFQANFDWCSNIGSPKENPAVSHLPSSLASSGLGAKRRSISNR